MTPTAAQVRQEFIDFFCQRHGHVFVPSSPVVPHDDPTLLFTNAGMNQFKPYFLGAEQPRHPRVANTQKCIRAGGKHNDLDDVGHDTYHHTFFEMLGNWSFGDYFKKEAIAWAWELLTKVWGLDKRRLHATYFGSNEATRQPGNEGGAGVPPADALPADLEARDLWLQVTDIDPSHVHAGSAKDNFWEMGETGPCGPCSEIHIDLTPDISGSRLVNAGDARVMEIWNLVFIQFNRGPEGKLTPLPARHVDTGMGFERVAAVLQGHNNNYATEVFVPIIQAIEKISGHKYGGSHEATEPRSHEGNVAAGACPPEVASAPRGRRVAADPRVGRSEPEAPAGAPRGEPRILPGGAGMSLDGVGILPGGVGILPANRYARFIPGDMRDEACRVIADHIRCLTFALTDGAIPDKEGRGYVLRRILRRAVRYGWQYLDKHEAFLYQLVPAVVQSLGDVFPELTKNPQHIANIIGDEEESFDRTLDRGIALFEEAVQRAHYHQCTIRAEDAFRLHDTYGFPIDLTQVMAQERHLKVDVEKYELLMEAAREKARSGTKGADLSLMQLSPSFLARFRATDDSAKYTSDSLHTRILGSVELDSFGLMPIRDIGGEILPGEHRAIVLERTCFYAESGGQVGDKGRLESGDARFDVEDTRQVGSVIVHIGTMVQGILSARSDVDIRVDPRRHGTMKNHTATHILNWALREVLGDHVQQKGSLVDPDKTRFDFSHPKPLTPAEIERIEQLVNERINQNLPVHWQEVDKEQALKIRGLRAVFGEHYPDRVRVLSVGVPVEELIKDPDSPRWREVSIEFCGGTHVRSTGEIEHFVLVSEEAVAKGVRRVVGLTGSAARQAEEAGAALVQRAEQWQHGPAENVPPGLAELQNALLTAVIPIRQRGRLRELIGELQRIVKQQQKAEAADAAHLVKERITELLKTAPKIGPTTVVIAEMPDVPIEQLKHGADTIKQKCGSAAVLFGVRVSPQPEPEAPARALSEPDAPARDVAAAGAPPTDNVAAGPRTGRDRSETGSQDPNRDREGADGARRPAGKALLLAAMTPDLVKKGLKAGDLVKAIAPIIDGGGGGPPTMAQAGGKSPEKLPEALRIARAWLLERLC